MYDFITWIESKVEKKDFIELYHGTTTGDDMERLKSFQQKGILPKSSSGHGQGSGYYAWSNQKNAERHADSLLGNNSPKTFQMHGGQPMVVSHKAKLNPKDYELDKEVHSQDIFKFFQSNENLINNLLKSKPIVVEPSDNGTYVVSITLYSMFFEPKFNALGFWLTDTETAGFDIKNVKQDKDYTYILPNRADDAADLNGIMQALMNQFPELAKIYKSFIRTIMKRSSEGRANPRAYKYVGDQPLKVNNVMARQK